MWLLEQTRVYGHDFEFVKLRSAFTEAYRQRSLSGKALCFSNHFLVEICDTFVCL